MKRFILLFILALLNYSPAWAQLNIVDRGMDWVELELQLPALDEPLQTIIGDDQQTYQRIVIEQWAKTVEVGAPELPVLATLIQVPDMGAVRIEDVTFNENTLETVADIYPVAQPIALETGEISQQFARDEQAYARNQLYPHTWLELGERAQLRGESVIQVKAYPIRWNPQTRLLHYLNQLRFRLVFEQPLNLDARQTRSAGSNFDSMLHNTINGYTPRRHERADEPVADNSFAPQRHSVNFEIPSTNMYKITYAELRDAGMPESCLKQGQFVLRVKD